MVVGMRVALVVAEEMEEVVGCQEVACLEVAT